MVTAERLNFDVLQIIFSYLSPSDLASLSQVCQSFLAGALPRLYRSLGFYHNQAKRYPRVRYRLSLENLTPLVIYAPEKDSDPLCRCQGTPKPGRARPKHRSASLLEGLVPDLIPDLDS